jgi:hypothetical protein
MEYLIENSFAPVNLDSSNKSIGTFALYTNRKDADLAVTALTHNGFEPSDISLLAPNKSGSRDFVYRQSSSVSQGAFIGAALGFILLGVLGFLFGTQDLAQGSTGVNIQGWHVSSALTTLAGALVGLIYGAVCGALVGAGSPKSAAKRYGFYLKEGGIVLVAHLKNEADSLVASSILEKTQGQDINILDESQIWSTIIPEKKRLVFS